MNRISNWLALLLGLGFAGVGGYALWKGTEIVLVDRGWEQVIAGAVVFSGGLVTFALALVLFKLEAIRRAVVAGAQTPRLISMPARDDAPPPPIDVEAAARPAAPPARTGPGGRGAGIAAGAIAGTAAAAYGASRLAERHDAEDASAVDYSRLEEDLLAHDAGEAEMPPGPAVWDETPPAAAAEAHAPAPAPAPPLPAPPLPVPSGAVEPPPPAVAPLPEAAGKLEDLDDDWLDRALSGRLEKEPPPPPLPPPPPEPEPPPRASDNVVARYEAGGVAYAMYDDGSIEADDGVALRRFASMADLRAHIAGAA